MQTEERPSVFNRAAKFIGGVTALLVALTGLKAAYDNLPPVHREGPPSLVYDKPNGKLRKNGDRWEETDKGRVIFTFKEISRSNGVTTILDESRTCYLKWPNGGGQVEVSIGIPMSWHDLYIVTPAP